jgi:WD40 repeat protein
MRYVSTVLCAVALVPSAASAQEPKELAVLKGPREASWHLAFSPDGKLLASCGDPNVKVWDVQARREIATFKAPEDVNWGRSVAFSPDGKTLAYRLDDGGIRLWDATTKGEPVVLGQTADGVGGLAFLSDGRLLAYGEEEATLFDPAARKPLAVMTGPSRSFYAAALSADDKTLVSGGHDGRVRLWDVGDKRLRAALVGHTRIVWAVAITPDGKIAASGGDDRAVKLWDVRAGDLLATLSGHGGRVTALAFTPDGNTLASTGGDNRLRFWDALTQKERLAMIVPGEMVRGVAFTRDGRMMATGNADGTIRLWDTSALASPRAEGATRRETIKGGIAHSPDDYLRITGKARVIDANTIAFDDGTEVDISSGADAPDLGQQGLLDGAFYPCGKEAAEFLRKLIGDHAATCYVNARHGLRGGRGDRMHGILYVVETRLDEAMIVNGWAVADHSSTVALELIARENKRGLWRGRFVAPREWRKGARLPGEPPAPRPVPAAGAPGAGGPPAAPTIVKEGANVIKVVGKADVVDAHTLRFADGILVELNGGMDAPDLEQLAAIGDGLYPWGREAADFLRERVGDRVVTCHVEGRRADRLRGDCFVEETQLQIEMVRNGWAVSHHTGMDGWQMFASEGRRGVWRGEFVRPEDWRKGDRLPGEPGETRVQREALQSLRKFDPVVTHDESKPGRPVVAIRFRPNTVEKVGDADLARLKVFTNLRSLDVPSAPKVTDAGLGHLAGLARLVELNVNWTGVTAEGVVRLVKGRLMMERLEVGGVPFRDEDLAALRGVRELSALSLRETLVTDEGLARLKRFEKLRSLSLMSTGVGDAGLKYLESLTALEDLDLDRTAITDAGLAHLEGLRRLCRLQIAHTAVTDTGLRHLEGLRCLEDLNTRGTSVTKDAVERFRKRTRLDPGPTPD